MDAATTTVSRQERGRTSVLDALVRRAFAPVDIASLVCFRVAFGAVMAWEVVRYFSHGWIASYYIHPQFHFTYYGFSWVRPWPGAGMYVHFALLGLAALGVMLGLSYRACALAFFVGFVYVFLLDQTNYLNHFYLIALLAFLLVFVPAHRAFSLDAWRRPALRSEVAPAWALWLLRAQVGIPYFFGGLAKLNADWLRGEPMRQWLAARADFPLLGPWFTQEWVVFGFIYGGLLLDLLIVPALLWRRTRPWAFGFALLFHGMNAVLFSIGIFPWLMMAATTIFFSPDWPRRLRLLPPPHAQEAPSPLPSRLHGRAVVMGLSAYLLVQVLVPLRHFLYPGEVSWTEEGHRFSWHMKLRDKEAKARFYVSGLPDGRTWMVDPAAHLTRRQTVKMAAHPDMVLQFAHHLAARLRAAGYPGAEVRVQVAASLNGREPQLMVDPRVNLVEQPRSMAPASWILPLRQPLPPPARAADPRRLTLPEATEE